jgi:hypothetical protein
MGDQEKIQGKKSNSNSKQVQVQTKISETLCVALFNTIKIKKSSVKLCVKLNFESNTYLSPN